MDGDLLRPGWPCFPMDLPASSDGGVKDAAANYGLSAL